MHPVDVLPNAETLLELPPEDLGAVILEVLHKSRERLVSLDIIAHLIYSGNSHPGYPTHSKQAVVEALAEAWAWLLNTGLLVYAPDQRGTSFCIITRRGKALKTAVDVQAFHANELLPRGLLSADLEEKVRPLFLRGDYEVAVFQAFKQVEVLVREGAGLAPQIVGVDLMRRAYHPENGALTDREDVKAEREGLTHLFAGAIAHAKNPPSHREFQVGKVEAARLIGLASYLYDLTRWRTLLFG